MVKEIIIELINEYKDKIKIIEILNLFDIPKSTYYRWKKNINNNDLSKNEIEVIKLCKEDKFRYGYRKITALIRKIDQLIRILFKK